MTVFKAMVAGHVCVDLVPRLAGPVDLSPGKLVEVGPMEVRIGGCVANTGGDLAALGAPVRLFADVGDDVLGKMLLGLLARSAADASGIRRVPNASTSYSVVVQPPGQDRTFWHHVGANARFDGSRVDLSWGDLLHVGYPPILPALLAEEAAPLRALLARARDAGLTTSVDLAVVDPASAAGRQDWATLLRMTLPLIDVLTPSVDDLASALRRPVDVSVAGLSAMASQLIDQGAGVVALTAGAAGLLLRTAGHDRLTGGGRVLARVAEAWADREVWVPALPVQVVSTTGAGDAATAGLLYGLLTSLGPREAAHVAAAAAALKVGGRRRLPPYADGTAYTVEAVSRGLASTAPMMVPPGRVAAENQE